MIGGHGAEDRFLADMAGEPVPDIPTLREFWANPNSFEAQQEVERALAHAIITEGMRALNERQHQRWREEA